MKLNVKVAAALSLFSFQSFFLWKISSIDGDMKRIEQEKSNSMHEARIDNILQHVAPGSKLTSIFAAERLLETVARIEENIEDYEIPSDKQDDNIQNVSIRLVESVLEMRRGDKDLRGCSIDSVRETFLGQSAHNETNIQCTIAIAETSANMTLSKFSHYKKNWEWVSFAVLIALTGIAAFIDNKK